MKLLPARSNTGTGRRGGTPLQEGVTASFLLIVVGWAGALVYTLAWGRGAVWLSPFITWLIALGSGTGGLVAGLRGGPRVWWPAGQIGVLDGGLMLVLLALLAPESLGYGDLLTYVLLPTGFSCAGALTGANMQVRSASRRTDP